MRKTMRLKFGAKVVAGTLAVVALAALLLSGTHYPESEFSVKLIESPFQGQGSIL
jgi:hypothetical protein